VVVCRQTAGEVLLDDVEGGTVLQDRIEVDGRSSRDRKEEGAG
jgi:hypothetical protein